MNLDENRDASELPEPLELDDILIVLQNLHDCGLLPSDAPALPRVVDHQDRQLNLVIARYALKLVNDDSFWNLPGDFTLPESVVEARMDSARSRVSEFVATHTVDPSFGDVFLRDYDTNLKRPRSPAATRLFLRAALGLHEKG